MTLSKNKEKKKLLTTGTCDIKFEMKSLVTPRQLSAQTDEKKVQDKNADVFSPPASQEHVTATDFSALQR